MMQINWRLNSHLNCSVWHEMYMNQTAITDVHFKVDTFQPCPSSFSIAALIGAAAIRRKVTAEASLRMRDSVYSKLHRESSVSEVPHQFLRNCNDEDSEDRTLILGGTISPKISSVLCRIWEGGNCLNFSFSAQISSMVPHPPLSIVPYPPLFFQLFAYGLHWFAPIYCSFAAGLALFVLLILHWSCLAG